MDIVLNVQSTNGELPPVEYRWDSDTDILTAHLRHTGDVSEGMTGSVELAGNDGSWLILDVKAGRLEGIEVAVWPDVRKVAKLSAPPAEDASIHLPARKTRGKVQLVQVDTPIGAEADPGERTIHFSLGGVRVSRSVRIARDVVLELGDHEALGGIWLLNVPPFPDDDA